MRAWRPRKGSKRQAAQFCRRQRTKPTLPKPAGLDEAKKLGLKGAAPQDQVLGPCGHHRQWPMKAQDAMICLSLLKPASDAR